MTPEHLWDRCAAILREELPISVWRPWFEGVRPVSFDGRTLVVNVPSRMAKERIESRWLKVVQDVLVEVAEGPCELVIEAVAQPSEAWTADDGADQEQASTGGFADVELNPAHTFENFVVGPATNGFAHAAAMSVAEKPGKAWNPLIIYGPTGLGKTHLLHAIGHLVRDTYPNLQVRYVTTETFLNDFVTAIRTGSAHEFKAHYRRPDILLIDDIQIIEGKEQFQIEFFHTFDFLHGAGRQVVLSSDRPPMAISTLDQRLRSRFAMGLTADVHPPALETRLAILQKKAESEPIEVPPEVLEYIADLVKENIRQLEGALNRVVAYASLNRVKLTLELAREVLADLLSVGRHVTPSRVLTVTADFFDLTVEDLRSKSRSRPLVNARQQGMFAMRQLTSESFPAIGRHFGNRDHTTVMHAVTKVEGLMREKRAIYDQVHELLNRIRNGG